MHNGAAKEKNSILKTVGGVIRTNEIPYKQHIVNNDLVQQLVFFLV